MGNNIRVLYIGNFRDGTGWAHAAIDYILALDAADIDVVPRAIKLNNVNGEVPDRIKELEKKDIKNPDVVIQNVLPHLVSYDGRINKNICLYTTETDNFKGSGWPKYINTMDEAWVFNDQSKKASENSGVEIPINVIPTPTNINKFNKSYEPIVNSDNFTFYTIGEINKRKNVQAIIKAFHMEFAPDEPVELVIKTTPMGMGIKPSLENICNEIKNGLKLYPDISNYKKEVLISEYWDEDNIMRLHTSCDCFISASHGEAWCIPAFDAMGMGKAVICPDFGGFKQYLNEENSWMIPGRMEPAFGELSSFSDLFTARENWFSIDILELRKAMREAYENKELRNKKGIKAVKRAYDFSYSKIGKLMKETLV